MTRWARSWSSALGSTTLKSLATLASWRFTLSSRPIHRPSCRQFHSTILGRRLTSFGEHVVELGSHEQGHREKIERDQRDADDGETRLVRALGAHLGEV